MKTFILIALLLSGCANNPETPKIVYVPQKCHIPEVENPDIDNTHYISNNDIIAKVLKNYVAVKEYSEKLLQAQKVCK